MAGLLSALKHDQRVGDKRLADLANDYAGVPLLHRSTIRNWSVGTSTTARNWQQIAAIAAALRLDEETASTLLLAASCEPIIDLRANAIDDDAHMLRYWPAEVPSPVEPSTDSADGSSPATVLADGPDLGIGLSTRRRQQLLVIMATLALTLSGLAFWQLLSDDETTTDSSVVVTETDLPAVAEIRAPSHDSVVGSEPLFSGTASHPNGISHVQMVLQRLDLGVYWNPDDQRWQERFRMFVVPVESVGASDTAWWYRTGADFPLPPGSYRARVWASAADGNGDPVGPLVEFTIAEDADLDNPRVADALRMQENPFPDARRQAEAAGVSMPKVRIRLPENGSERAISTVRIKALAEYEAGVAELQVALRDVDGDRYWNFATNRWQAAPTSLETIGDDDTQLEVDLWMPDEAIEPGTFEVIASAVGIDGSTFDVDEVSTFTVRGS